MGNPFFCDTHIKHTFYTVLYVYSTQPILCPVAVLKMIGNDVYIEIQETANSVIEKAKFINCVDKTVSCHSFIEDMGNGSS